MAPYQVIWLVTCGLALYALARISHLGTLARARYHAFAGYLVAYLACSAILIWYSPTTRIYDYVWSSCTIVVGIASAWAAAECIARIRSHYPYDRLLTWYAAVALVVAAAFAAVLASVPAWHTIDWNRPGITVQLVTTGQQALSIGLALSMLSVYAIARIWPARQAANVRAHVFLLSAWQLAGAVSLAIVNIHRTDANWALATYIEQGICLACMLAWCCILRPDRENRPGAALRQVNEDIAWDAASRHAARTSVLARAAIRYAGGSLQRAYRSSRQRGFRFLSQ